MITDKEYNQLCELKGRFEETLNTLLTADASAVLSASYEFHNADRDLEGYLLSLRFGPDWKKQ